MPAEGTPCDEYTAKIVVSNSGSGEARGVKLSDELPAGLTTRDGKSMVSHNVGTLGAGESKEFSFPIKATKAGQFSNFATASADGGLTAKSTPVSIQVRQPALAVNVECPTGPIQMGKTGAFKFSVKNTSDTAVTNAQLVTTIAGGAARFASAEHGLTDTNGKISWKIGSIPAGGEKVFTASYRLMAAGTVKAQASATGYCVTQVDKDCTTTVVGVADIGTLLTDSQGVTLVGDPQEYTLEVENQGQVDLTNVKVVVNWPAELSFVSATLTGRQPTMAGNSATFDVGVVKVGEKKRWTVSLAASKAGEYVISTVTTAKEIKNPTNQEEITTFVD
jgi:uncharacterized repeat protein (TIGR01451 family)